MMLKSTVQDPYIRTWRILPGGIQLLDLGADFERLDDVSRRLPDGVYTTFRTYAGRRRVIGLKAHLDRLEESAGHYGWTASLDRPYLRQVLRCLLDHAAPAEARVRITRDMTHEMGSLYISLQCMHPLPPEVYLQGVAVQTCHLQRSQPQVKTTEFIPASRDLKASLPGEIFELLLVGDDGYVLEGMTSNFFGVLDNRVYTAQEGVLLGVTRQEVLNVAAAVVPELGMEIVLQPLHQKQLPDLCEAFITSSSRGIVPVATIDGQPVHTAQPGPLTRRLMQAYQQHLEDSAEEI